MQPDALVPNTTSVWTALPWSSRCTDPGGESEHPDQVVLRGFEIVIDENCGGAVKRGVKHGHLLQDGDEFLGQGAAMVVECLGGQEMTVA